MELPVLSIHISSHILYNYKSCIEKPSASQMGRWDFIVGKSVDCKVLIWNRSGFALAVDNRRLSALMFILF